MTEIEYRLSDLMNFSSNQKPVDFEMAFHEIITPRINNTIQNAKMEIAKSMFAPVDDYEIESNSEEETDGEEF
jgi:hypothetical protein